MQKEVKYVEMLDKIEILKSLISRLNMYRKTLLTSFGRKIEIRNEPRLERAKGTTKMLRLPVRKS